MISQNRLSFSNFVGNRKHSFYLLEVQIFVSRNYFMSNKIRNEVLKKYHLFQSCKKIYIIDEISINNRIYKMHINDHIGPYVGQDTQTRSSLLQHVEKRQYEDERQFNDLSVQG